MKRFKISKRHSKRLFRRTSGVSKKVNVSRRHRLSRGGIRF